MADRRFDQISPEQQLSLRRSISELEDRFKGVFGHETIERVLLDCYESLLPTAKTKLYLPIIAEKFARERLNAIGRTEGSLPSLVPGVLFLCVQNAGRSQMAAGWLRHLARDAVVVWSGGSEPASEINPVAIAVMSEVGIDITGEFPKPWNDDIVRAADVVVTMGCGDACPVYPGKRYEDWSLDDPAGLDVEAVRRIRDEIRVHVELLIVSLGIDLA